MTMKWNVGTKMGAGFGLVLLVFAIVGAGSSWSITQLIGASDARKHTVELLAILEATLSSLKDTETCERGYVLTGEERYLETYQAALSKIDPGLQEVRRRTADNAQQQRRLDVLESLVKNRLAFEKEIIDARRTNSFEAAVALVKTGKGKGLMDEIHKVIGEMESDEQDLLKKRVEAAEADGRNAKRIILIGTLMALAVAALAGFVITRNIARPLEDLTAVADRITVGDLTVKVSANGRSDEVGVLGRTFDRMTQSLRTMAGAAEQIAGGDLRSTIKPQSPNDVLGNA